MNGLESEQEVVTPCLIVHKVENIQQNKKYKNKQTTEVQNLLNVIKCVIKSQSQLPQNSLVVKRLNELKLQIGEVVQTRFIGRPCVTFG